METLPKRKKSIKIYPPFQKRIFYSKNMQPSTAARTILQRTYANAYTCCDDYRFSWACATGDIHTVSLFLNYAPHLDPRAHHECAFLLACINGHDKIVELLLNDQRVDPRSHNSFAFYVACRNGHAKTVRHLLNDIRIDATCQNNACFGIALTGGHIDTVRLLLGHGVCLGVDAHRNFAGTAYCKSVRKNWSWTHANFKYYPCRLQRKIMCFLLCLKTKKIDLPKVTRTNIIDSVIETYVGVNSPSVMSSTPILFT